MSFLKDTFCDAGLGSTASKSDLMDGDHEEGTLSSSSKGKEPIYSSKGKAPVYDIREGTLQLCSSKGKEPICDNMERIQGPCSSHGTSPSVTSEETHDLFISVVHNVMLYMCNYLLCSTFHQSSFKHTDRDAYICLLLSLL